MDEYLFLEMAKLKADREKLARTEPERKAEANEAARRREEASREPLGRISLPLLSWR